MAGISVRRLAGAALPKGSGRRARTRAAARHNPRDMRFIATSLLASLALMAVLFLYIWCRLTVVGMGYELSRANMERDALMERNRRLKIEYMRLKSPERIERIASTELGLVHPAESQIVRVEP